MGQARIQLVAHLRRVLGKGDPGGEKVLRIASNGPSVDTLLHELMDCDMIFCIMGLTRHLLWAGHHGATWYLFLINEQSWAMLLCPFTPCQELISKGYVDGVH